MEENKYTASILGNRKQPLFGVKRGIVHHNPSTFVKGGQKLIRKPGFEKIAVHCSIVLEWGENPVPHFGGNNATALIFSATDASQYLMTPWPIPIFPI